MQINLHLLALIPIFVLQNVTRAMVTLDAIRGPVAQELEEFDAFVRRNFKVENELLSGMVDYILSSRGKGVRPRWYCFRRVTRRRPGAASGSAPIWQRCSSRSSTPPRSFTTT